MPLELNCAELSNLRMALQTWLNLLTTANSTLIDYAALHRDVEALQTKITAHLQLCMKGAQTV